MEWKSWIGKEVFVRLKKGDCYNGRITDVDNSAFPLVFISLVDRYHKDIMFVPEEISKIVEQDKRG